MYNKDINIAEILKDCPMGMKLYSPLFGHVVGGVRGYCFDVVYAIPLFTSTWPLYGVVVNDYKRDVEIVGSIHDKEWQEKLKLKTE